MFIFYITGLAGIILLVVAIVWHLRRPKLSSLELKLLAIRLPKVDQKEGQNANFLQEINISEQLVGSLAAIDKPFAFEVAVHNTGSDINFYLAVPRPSVDFATRQIQGLFPNAQVTEAPEYNIFNPSGGHAGAYLKLETDYALPLRTYKEGEVDTFAPVVNSLSKLKEVGDGAALQFIFVPAGNDPKKRIFGFINSLKKGEKLKDLFGLGFLGELKEIVVPMISSAKSDKPEAPKIVDEEAVKALNAKIAKPLFKMQVRLVTSGDTKDRAEDLMLSIGGAFSQFTAPVRNGFKIVKVKDTAKFFYQFSFREFIENQSMILNTEEISSVFHLPTSSTEVPRISWLKSREAPPPANLPDRGVVIGNSIFRGEEKAVHFSDEDRARHLYIIGQTGTGKSMGMLSMAIQDMPAGKGFCVIDPHGDLIDKVLSLVPPERIDDVIVFDPGDLSRPLGLNMLEYDLGKPEEKTFIVNEMLSIFDRLYDLKATGGPQFEQYMKNALMLLMEDAKNEPATLMEVARIFTDAEWRKKKLARISNPIVVDFWEKEASKTTGEAGLANMTPYVTSKFNSFTANDYMRPIIGQTKSAFNFRQVMDEGKILLVNLSKGKIGDLNAQLIGMIIVGRLLMAALSRVDIAEKERKDFYLYIDEFQNFTTDSISVILSEARKYRLCLTLAHQFIAQLEDDIREAVFGNVGSMMCFRVGSPDTEFLVKQFGPEFTERDLISVENGHAFAKLLVNGEPSRPFNLKTLRVPNGSIEVREKLKELSRLTYGRDLAEIESEILARLRK